MKRSFSAGLFLILIVFQACDSKRVYEGKKDFSDKFWTFNDPAVFDFEIPDTGKKYNMLFNIRHTADYKYQNIYLQYYLEDSTGRLVSKELINIQLFNAITGVPLGKSIGGIYDLQRAFLEDFSFDRIGKYHMQIEQFMRQDSLPGILSIGLRVEYAGESD